MIPAVNKGGVSSQRVTFEKHMPRNFGDMMNYLNKNTPDIFEHTNSVRVSTILKDGSDVAGTVNYRNGKYVGLVLDEGFEHLHQDFMRTALEKYKSHIASRQLEEKLARHKFKKLP